MKVVELRAAMDARFAQVDERFVGIDEQLVRIDEQFAEVRGDIVALGKRIESSKTETRRHFDVIAEHLRSDIALLAGAVASIATMLERSLAENASEHRVMASAFDNHEIRLTALERRSV